MYYGDPPNSAWSQLPELPSGALPHLARLHLDCVGLPSLPPSWCRWGWGLACSPAGKLRQALCLRWHVCLAGLVMNTTVTAWRVPLAWPTAALDVRAVQAAAA